MKTKLKNLGKKISNGFKDKKKRIIYICSIILIIIIIIFIVLALTDFSGVKKSKANSAAKRVTKAYYEDFYYKNMSSSRNYSDLKKILTIYEKDGMNLYIRSATSIIDQKKYEDDIKLLNKYGCDNEKSFISIYPEKPFKQKDYKIKINLNCSRIK